MLWPLVEAEEAEEAEAEAEAEEVGVVTAEAAVTEAAALAVGMAVATVVVKAAGAVAALPAVWAEQRAEAHPLFRLGKRCRRKAASPAIVGPRDTLRGIRCRPRVA